MISNIHKKFVSTLIPIILPFILSSLKAQSTFNINQFLQKNIEQLGLSLSDISDYTITDNYITKHNQVTHIYLQQQHQGIKIYNAMINLNIQNNQVFHYGNKFIPHLNTKINANIPTLSPINATTLVFQYLNISSEVSSKTINEINQTSFVLDKTNIALEDIPIQLIYFPKKDNTIHLAWNIRIYTLDAQHLWDVYIDALSGEILYVDDWVIKCNFEPNTYTNQTQSTYQTYCDTHSEHSQQQNSTSAYRVFDLPFESPLHGNRVLVSNPHDTIASPFGWHDIDGSNGSDFTITRGNNVHAYSDLNNNNASQNNEPDGGASLIFDFPLDLTQEPNMYQDAAVTNLFYITNKLHDTWYRYGFDEVAGNYQLNNYSNGGQGNDYIVAEAQDANGLNNASFAAFPDGTYSRMEFLLWQKGNPGTVTINTPNSVSGNYSILETLFGNNLSTPITANLEIVDDGSNHITSALGCGGLINNLTGKIALIDRGGSCESSFKVKNAENVGAIAAIICNHRDELTTILPGSNGGLVTIPSVLMKQSDCDKIKIALQNQTVNLTLTGNPVSTPLQFDSDLDNGVITHEFGHGISKRLTGGPSTVSCLSNIEEQGEGWSDWFALVMTTHQNDLSTDIRGIGTYLIDGNPLGKGIRTYPYSTDKNINPHTFEDAILENIPHGVGSVWAAMIWDLYWALIEAHGFDSDINEGTGGNNIAMQLIIDGLKMQPCSPSFTEARDAILAADVANNNGINQCLIWSVFAQRGLGFSANAGNSGLLTDNIQAFDVPNTCFNDLIITKTADFEIMNGEDITYTITVQNATTDTLTNIIAKDTLANGLYYILNSGQCNMTENNGIITIPIGSLLPNTSTSCTFKVNANLNHASIQTYVNPIPKPDNDWNASSNLGNDNWEIKQNAANAHSNTFYWEANTANQKNDFYLTSSQPFTISGQHPTFRFWHQFDTDPGISGGVVEISTDLTYWRDLGDKMIINGYNKPMRSDILRLGRYAFSGNQSTYQQTYIDLTDYIGQSVYIRFRMTNSQKNGSSSGYGWRIDDISMIDLTMIQNKACVSSQQGFSNCTEVPNLGTTIIGTTVSSSEPQKRFDFYLYPNPAKKIVHLYLDNSISQGGIIQLFSINGQLLQTEKLTQNQNNHTTVDLDNFPNGLYIIKITTTSGIGIKRLIINQ